MIRKLSLFSLFGLILLAGAQSYKKTQLKDVDVLTFQKGSLTTSRRNLPVKQLQCVGGLAHSESNLVETVQCKNMGYDGNDYNWECKTHIEPHLKLGKTTVVCEGYSYPNDLYILVGSCSLEYSLEYTNGKPPVRTPTPSRTPAPSRSLASRSLPTTSRVTTNEYSTWVNEEDTKSPWITLFLVIYYYMVLFVLVFSVASCIYCICFEPILKSRKRHYKQHESPAQDSSSTPPPPPPPPLPPAPMYTSDPTSAFTNGVMVGSILTHRRTPTATHTHTHSHTVVEKVVPAVTPPPTSPPSPSPEPEPSTKPTEESTSYATTKRR